MLSPCSLEALFRLNSSSITLNRSVSEVRKNGKNIAVIDANSEREEGNDKQEPATEEPPRFGVVVVIR